MKNIEIFVPYDKLERMSQSISCGKIGEGKPVNSEVFMNKKYVITDGCGSGNGGWQSLGGYCFTRLEAYTGDLKPLSYHEHQNDMQIGNRESGYTGMLIHCDGQEVVIVGSRIRFVPTSTETPEQLNLF